MKQKQRIFQASILLVIFLVALVVIGLHNNPQDIREKASESISNVYPSGASTMPSGSKLAVSVILHGIGKGGDNVNAQPAGNNSPLHPERTVFVDLYTATDQLVSTKQGTVTLQPSGSFIGMIDTGDLNLGSYSAKIRSPQYLTRAIPGILQISANETEQMPEVSLVTGDINEDNKLSILDYNMLLDCYSDETAARNCVPTAKKSAADLTDDGRVNQYDYNLFLRELLVQPGADFTPTPTAQPSFTVREFQPNFLWSNYIARGDTVATVTGTGFTQGMTVIISGPVDISGSPLTNTTVQQFPLQNIQLISSTQIKGTIPPGLYNSYYSVIIKNQENAEIKLTAPLVVSGNPN